PGHLPSLHYRKDSLGVGTLLHGGRIPIPAYGLDNEVGPHSASAAAGQRPISRYSAELAHPFNQLVALCVRIKRHRGPELERGLTSITHRVDGDDLSCSADARGLHRSQPKGSAADHSDA